MGSIGVSDPREMEEASPTPDASIVITSRNRRADVLRAVASCMAQENVNLEVLVYDDASEDGTAAAVREAWPQCRVFESSERSGYIVNRNRGFRDSGSGVVFSLDDDAYFSAKDTVARVVARFTEDDTIGAVAIPYVEPLNRRSLSSLARPFGEPAGAELRSYVGCAHAVRRDVALALGGYRDFFVHQHEEREFCLRLRAAGWRVVYGDGEPIVHMVSPNRDQERVTRFGGRNQILTEFLNAPFPEVVFRVIRTSVGLIRYRFSLSSLPIRAAAIWSGLRDSFRYRALRKSVSREFYQAHRLLPGHGALHWESPVPPPCHKSVDE